MLGKLVLTLYAALIVFIIFVLGVVITIALRYAPRGLIPEVVRRGTKKGHIHGVTADERPLIATKNPVSIMDLHATIMTAMGISPKTEFEIEGRPFYVTEDGKGKAVTEIFA